MTKDLNFDFKTPLEAKDHVYNKMHLVALITFMYANVAYTQCDNKLRAELMDDLSRIYWEIINGNLLASDSQKIKDYIQPVVDDCIQILNDQLKTKKVIFSPNYEH